MRKVFKRLFVALGILGVINSIVTLIESETLAEWLSDQLAGVSNFFEYIDDAICACKRKMSQDDDN